LREDQDQRDDHDQERQGCGVTAQSQPALVARFIEKIPDDGSERASQNERHPKQNYAQRKINVRRFAIAVSLAFAARVALGQGGPPMITDDPGTPGNGKWENNFAFAFEHRPGETGYEVPAIDLNYGLGDHIQVTLQTAPVLLKRHGHGLIGGLGGH
jgi:hypothetical protein